jgi:hypothetical protein
MFLLTFFIHDVRDVGVAGSNPVTPTTDFVDVFHSINPLGSTLNQPLRSSWGPVSRVSVRFGPHGRRSAGYP